MNHLLQRAGHADQLRGVVAEEQPDVRTGVGECADGGIERKIIEGSPRSSFEKALRVFQLEPLDARALVGALERRGPLDDALSRSVLRRWTCASDAGVRQTLGRFIERTPHPRRAAAPTDPSGT